MYVGLGNSLEAIKNFRKVTKGITKGETERKYDLMRHFRTENVFCAHLTKKHKEVRFYMVKSQILQSALAATMLK